MKLHTILESTTETDWERWDEKTQSWKHNHRQRNWNDDQKKPTPVSDLQKSAWKNAKWRKKKVQH